VNPVRRSARRIFRLAATVFVRQRALIAFRRQFKTFARLALNDDRSFALHWADRYPQLRDATAKTRYDAHYLYHPAWATRLIATTSPGNHVDISSLLSFAAMLSAFVPVLFFDYRPANLRLGNLREGCVDLTSLPFRSLSLKSVSCMHVVEHIGLGRYGDRLDSKADFVGMRELQRVLAPGGNLFFVVPVGKPRIVFNAHRIYSFEQIRTAFNELVLREFSLIPDNGEEAGLIRGASPDLVHHQDYGCGCFWFQRPAAREIGH
jgi:Caenorhabditis protein of unknown function, DUF268